MAEFDIQFTILRGDEEIGFGAGLGNTIEHALETVAAIIERREWETTPGMPDPAETYVIPPGTSEEG